jgi:hypothetical protein
MKERTSMHTHATIQAFEEQWESIVGATAAAFRMDSAEAEWLRTKPIARLIAALPFLAGCRHASRTAVAHLGTYLMSIRDTKPYFNASSQDDGDILDRLQLIGNFDGGDKGVIDRGMALIALSMILDYQRDIQIDAAIGKYNPVASGAFDFEATRERLEQTIQAVDCPQMDEILSMDDVGTLGFWSSR